MAGNNYVRETNPDLHPIRRTDKANLTGFSYPDKEFRKKARKLTDPAVTLLLVWCNRFGGGQSESNRRG